jgi:hypothetical protein
MSTDLRDRTSPPSPDEGPDQHEKPKSALSITQVVGGALAAMTAAALGSRLSVAGTVVGAAFASVIAAVAGSIYTASLRRTSQHVSRRLKSRGQSAAPGQAAAAAPGWTASDADTDLHTAVDPRSGLETPSGLEPAGRAAVGGAHPVAPAPAERRGRIGWKPVVAAALLMFAIAAVALTGIELVTGHALSGGTGTTVGQVAEGGSKPSSRPSGARTASPSPSRSATQSAEPTATPSSTASSKPTPGPTASDSAAPSATPTPTSSASPSPSGFSPRATPGS